jgi:hypothetical protein
MAGTWKRREFLHAVAAGGALGGLAWGADDEPRLSTQVNRQAIEAEVRRRADRQLEAVRLVVDYYRIGRKIAYPLPLEELIIPEVNVPSIPVYPWATWLTWTLEERIGCLGWAAQWFDHKEARQRAAADLAALARWPRFQQYANPDLSSAHAGRILWTAATRWGWVESGLRKSLHEACRRHVEAVLPASDKLHASIRTKDDVLRRDAPHALLHNIPLIGAIGAALTAATAGHPAAELLNDRIHALFGAVLDLRAKGYTEGVAYDGYVLDFAADWLAALPDGERSDLLDHPGLNQYLEQSYMLGAPGAAEQVAELSDVEPREMPFHLSAQAKLLRLRPDPLRWWLLGRCPLDVLRCDALAALGGAAGVPAIPAITAITAPPAGALDAHYAAVLRSGWEADDLAVAVSCSSSPMGHIQNDAGALVIGTHGRWLITDPGYQQYVQGDQREFTVGPAAHNAPLVNGSGPAEKRPRRIVSGQRQPNRSPRGDRSCGVLPRGGEVAGAARMAVGQEPRGRGRRAGCWATASSGLPLAWPSGCRLVVRSRLGAGRARRGAALGGVQPCGDFRGRSSAPRRLARPALARFHHRPRQPGGLVGIRTGSEPARAGSRCQRPADSRAWPVVQCVRRSGAAARVLPALARRSTWRCWWGALTCWPRGALRDFGKTHRSCGT